MKSIILLGNGGHCKSCIDVIENSDEFQIKGIITNDKDFSERFKTNNIRTSIFLDPDQEQLEIAKEINIDRVELYTGPFARAFEEKDIKTLKTYQEAISFANNINVSLNAGHDLNLSNLPTLLEYGDIKEVSIGHALIIESLELGVKETIKRYLKILK